MIELHVLTAISQVDIAGSALSVRFNDGEAVLFEDCWLRDHCRCPKCYHADTFQRAQHLIDIPESTFLKVDHNGMQLTVVWSDNHESSYKADFLRQYHYPNWKESGRLKPILWRGQNVADRVARVRVDSFLTSKDGAKAAFQSLLDYGVVLIEGVEPTSAATEKVCSAFGGVQNTVFGGMWEFSTKPLHADTAYSNLALAPHNDNTYFTEAAGLQILHCIEHTNGTGGETILTDGFYGANCLKDDNPENFDFLSTFNVEAEYKEDGHYFKYSAPVIKVDDKTDDLVQIRFNVYDRAPMAFPSSYECRAYYRSLRNLSMYFQDPSNQWRFKLKPGVVMVMDNFRVLHGRTSFTGNRTLCGSYVSRSDWLDKARALKLIQ